MPFLHTDWRRFAMSSSDKWLGEVATLCDSRRIPVSPTDRRLRIGSYPYIGDGSSDMKIDDYNFEGLYVLVGEDRAIATPEGTFIANLIDGKNMVGKSFHVIQGSDDVDTRFLHYALAGTSASRYLTGIDLAPKLTTRDLARVAIPWPDRNQREKTVEIALALDERISLFSKRSATLTVAMEKLYKEVFPLEVEEGNPRFETASFAQLGELCTPLIGKELLWADRVDEGIPIYTAHGVRGGHNEALTEGSSIIVAASSSLGAVLWAEEPCWPLATTYYVDCNSTMVPLPYLYFAFKSINLRSHRATGSAVVLDMASVLEERINVGTPALRERFGDLARAALDELALLEERRRTMRRLRAELVPRLVHGTIDLENG